MLVTLINLVDTFILPNVVYVTVVVVAVAAVVVIGVVGVIDC